MASWQEKAKQKRDSINNLIPEEWRLKDIPSVEQQPDVTEYIRQFLNDKELEITETDAIGIVQKTSTGAWSAVDVTKAFCHRAALAHQLVNCLHEIFFDAAIEDAKKLDEYFAEHKKPVGSLHGLPISLKDQFHVKGVETTMGYVGWIGTFQGKTGTGKEKVFESEMVRELRTLGAVLYVKTSVPHTLMAGETHNNIIGYTTNPKNRHLACGGSSGGEGALIGLKGSPIGLGTDIGGSIRIPAGFNGLYGLRPSVGRLPYEGMANSMEGQNSILSVVGPLATSAASLRLLTKAVLSEEPWLHDPLVHELPWQEQKTAAVGNDKLTFGLLRHDGVVKPSPPIRRALDIVVDVLKEQGHEVIEWKPPSQKDIHKTGVNTWIYDGGEDVHAAFALSGEPPVPQITTYGDKPFRQFTASEIAATNVAIRELRKQYLDYWASTASQTSTGKPVDAVIAPLAPFPAARQEMYYYYGYSTFINLLDYTSVVVPVTNVDKSIDRADEPYDFTDDIDKKCYESYDPEIYQGAHVALQIFGRRLQEEKMIAVAEYVGKLLGKEVV